MWPCISKMNEHQSINWTNTWISLTYRIFLVFNPSLFLFSTTGRLKWSKLSHSNGPNECPRHIPFQRYGHSVVVYNDKIYLWGGRNDTSGADNKLYSFDTSKLSLSTLIFGAVCYMAALKKILSWSARALLKFVIGKFRFLCAL